MRRSSTQRSRRQRSLWPMLNSCCTNSRILRPERTPLGPPIRQRPRRLRGPPRRRKSQTRNWPSFSAQSLRRTAPSPQHSRHRSRVQQRWPLRARAPTTRSNRSHRPTTSVRQRFGKRCGRSAKLHTCRRSKRNNSRACKWRSHNLRTRNQAEPMQRPRQKHRNKRPPWQRLPVNRFRPRLQR